MKLGFFADTHDNLPMVIKAVRFFNLKQVDLVLHLGDFVSPFFISAINDLKAGFVGIFGNNDGDKLMLQTKFRERGLDLFNPPYTINKDGRKILMMHEPFELDALIKSGEYNLTKREMEILSLMSKGEDNRKIADLLNINIRTVANHVSNILYKVDAKNRTEAAVIARKLGLID